MTKLLVSSAPVFELDGQVKGELARDVLFLEVQESTAGLKTMAVTLGGIWPCSGEHARARVVPRRLSARFRQAGEGFHWAGRRSTDDLRWAISGMEVQYSEGTEPGCWRWPRTS